MLELVRLLLAVAVQAPSAAAEADLEPSLEVAEIVGATGAPDGDLAEWTAPPTFVTRDREGCESRIWLGIGTERVRIAAKGEVGRVEIALASPPPTLPPVGWRTWIDVVEPTGEEECPALAASGGAALPDDVERCRAWLRQAAADRAALAARFRARIVIEAGASVDGAPVDAKVVRRGDALEVDLPITALPATTQMPLTALRALARVGARTARWAEPPPELWPLARLGAPVRFGVHPESAGAAIAHTDLTQRLAFYEPGVAASRVQLVYHPILSEPGIPSVPSPAIVELPTDKPRRVGSFAGQELLQVPVDMGEGQIVEQLALRTADGGLRLFESALTQSAPTRVLARDRGVDLVYLEQGIRNPAGRGYCFACEKLSIRVVRVDGAGATHVFDEDIDADAMERLETWMSPSGTSIRVRAYAEGTGEGDAGPPRLTHTTRVLFDAASRTWIRRED